MKQFDPAGIARRAVLGLPVYSPGRSPEEIARTYGIQECVKMASNENPLGPSPRAMQAIAGHLESINIYPDPDSCQLRSALSGKLGVGEENILVTHGADEALDLIAYAFMQEGDDIVVGDPSFSSYELAALTMGARITKVPLAGYRQDLPAMSEAIGPHTKAVFICTPLNPTGTAVGVPEWEEFLDAYPGDALLVLDEAYVEYVEEAEKWDSLSYLASHPYLVITRTFSKICGLAGLRVGYAICSPAVRELLEKVKLPFNVNRLAQIAALAALEDSEHLRASLDNNARGKERIYRLLAECGFEYVPTQANFILVKNGRHEGLFETLLRHGVIVRAGEPLGVPGHVRVTVGDEAQNDLLETALRSISGSGKAE